MNLIKYYPITTYLVQDLVYEEIIDDDYLSTMIKYNKYSDMIVDFINKRSSMTRVNDKLHSINDEPAMKHYIRLREGDPSSFTLRGCKIQVWLKYNEIHRDGKPAFFYEDDVAKVHAYVNDGKISKLVVEGDYPIKFSEYRLAVEGNLKIYTFNDVKCVFGLFNGIIREHTRKKK